MPPRNRKVVDLAQNEPEIQFTDELQNECATVLIYGGAGVGKTTLLKQLHEYYRSLGQNMLTFAMEKGETRGLLSVRSLRIPFIDCPNWDTCQYVVNKIATSEDRRTYRGMQFHCAVFDSWTQAGDLWIRKYLGMKGREETGIGTTEKGDRWDPRQVFAYVAEKGRLEYDRAEEGLAMDLVFICREGLFQTTKDESVFDQTPCPDLPGQRLVRETPGWPDATVRMVVKSGQRIFITAVEDNAPARVRFDVPGKVLPKYIRADLPLLIRLLKGDTSVLSQMAFAAKQVEPKIENATATAK